MIERQRHKEEKKREAEKIMNKMRKGKMWENKWEIMKNEQLKKGKIIRQSFGIGVR